MTTNIKIYLKNGNTILMNTSDDYQKVLKSLSNVFSNSNQNSLIVIETDDSTTIIRKSEVAGLTICNSSKMLLLEGESISEKEVIPDINSENLENVQSQLENLVSDSDLPQEDTDLPANKSKKNTDSTEDSG